MGKNNTQSGINISFGKFKDDIMVRLGRGDIDSTDTHPLNYWAGFNLNNIYVSGAFTLDELKEIVLLVEQAYADSD